MVHFLGCRIGLCDDRTLRDSAIRGGDCASLGLGAELERVARVGPVLNLRQSKNVSWVLRIHQQQPTKGNGSPVDMSARSSESHYLQPRLAWVMKVYHSLHTLSDARRGVR